MGKQGYEQVGVAMTCRGYDEYVRMFDLQPADLERGEVLDVAAGGSSFTAEANARGYHAYAVDPRYDKGIEEWISEAQQEIETSTAKLTKLKDRFDWSYYGTIQQHKAGRVSSIERFKENVRDNKEKHRYTAGKLPELPYSDNRFSMILCSHFMFLYADQFGTEFHIEAMKELMRICKPGGQIRVYPLLSLNWEPYPGLEQLMNSIKENGGSAELFPSHLPFIPGSSQYLKVSL